MLKSVGALNVKELLKLIRAYPEQRIQQGIYNPSAFGCFVEEKMTLNANVLDHRAVI